MCTEEDALINTGQVLVGRTQNLHAETELWKRDHVLAMMVFDLQKLLERIRNLWEAICNQRDQTSSHTVSCQKNHQQLFKQEEQLLRDFVALCSSVESLLVQLESEEFEVDHASDFRQVCSQATRLAKPLSDRELESIKTPINEWN